jgi:hypothetical protein
VLLAALLAHVLLADATWASASLRGFARACALVGTGLLLRPALPGGLASDVAWAFALAGVAAAWAPAGVRSVALGVALVLLLAFALTALTSRIVREPGAPARVTLAVVLLAGAAPLWAGPLAEQVEPVARLVLVTSPLTLLATLAGHDYLRDPWFYAHSVFGALRVEPPSALVLGAGYAATSGLLLAAARLPSLIRSTRRQYA